MRRAKRVSTRDGKGEAEFLDFGAPAQASRHINDVGEGDLQHEGPNVCDIYEHMMASGSVDKQLLGDRARKLHEVLNPQCDPKWQEFLVQSFSDVGDPVPEDEDGIATLSAEEHETALQWAVQLTCSCSLVDGEEVVTEEL